MSSDTPRLDGILDAIRQLGGKAKPAHVVERTGLERGNVQGGLRLLVEHGGLKKLKGKGNFGYYALPEYVEDEPSGAALARLPVAHADLPLHSIIPLISIEVGGKLHTRAELVIRSSGDEARVKVGG